MHTQKFSVKKDDKEYGYYDAGVKQHLGWEKNDIIPNFYMDSFLEVFHICQVLSTYHYKLFPHRNSGIEINHVLNGNAMFTLNNKKYVLRHKSIIIAPQQETHSCYPMEQKKITMLGFCVFFRREPQTDTEKIIYECLTGNSRPKSWYDHFNSYSIHSKILYLCGCENAYKSDLMKYLVYSYLLSVCAGQTDAGHISQESFMITEVLDYLNTQLKTTSISLNKIAEKISVSVSTLSNKFKAYTDMSVISYFLFTKLEDTKHLLVNSDMSITKIAEEYLYPDNHYYCKRFKKTFGITPSQYRELARNM
jgi:AraC-like DNA-binding protein